MKTDTYLHEQLDDYISKLLPVPPAGGRPPLVIDLGCGEGALSQRLHDRGFKVIAVDMEAGDFKATGPTFIEVNFNDPSAVEQFVAAHRGLADLVLSVEVIEHVRNPWDFIATCRALCGPATHLLVSTPNVSSWWSRFWFLLTGELWGFAPESWHDPGHINPIAEVEMRGILRDSGFETEAVIAAGHLPILWGYNWKRLLISIAMLPWRLVMRGQKDGWVLCYHARLAR